MAALAVAASGAGLGLGGGLHPVWWLAWLAPAPVLLLASRVSAKGAFVAAFMAWGIGGLGLWPYLRNVLGIPLAAVVVILLVPAVVFALLVLLHRGLVLRGRLWAAAFGFPAGWVGYEYILAVTSPHSTFGNVAYSQMDFPDVLQIASVVGVWGIGYSLMLFPALVAALLATRGGRRGKTSLALAGGASLLAVLAFGSWRRQPLPAGSGQVRVGLVASDLHEDENAADHDGNLRLLAEYAAQAERVAAEGAEVVVLPEKLAAVADEWLPEVDSQYLAAASRSHTAIVVGVIHRSAAGPSNEARIYLPGATVAATYEKHHMLPGFESTFKVGMTRLVWPEPSGRWGVAICKDMDFPALGREYGQDGAGLLLVPAWDFAADGWLHGRMAVMRGVESGFSVARSPRRGVLTATDDRGRVVAERDSAAAPFSTLVATLPVGRGGTFYSRFGDWFAWLCLAGVAIASLRAAGSRGSGAAARGR